jgi:hypothetical protein
MRELERSPVVERRLKVHPDAMLLLSKHIIRQERVPTPVPSDDDEEEMTYDQARLVRRFRNVRRPSTALGMGATNLKAVKG